MPSQKPAEGQLAALARAASETNYRSPYIPEQADVNLEEDHGSDLAALQSFGQYL